MAKQSNSSQTKPIMILKNPSSYALHRKPPVLNCVLDMFVAFMDSSISISPDDAST
jgi:hypothetical protein